MPAEISVVMPTLNAEAHLPSCLQALMEGVAAGLICELIISDGGSQDATVEMADAAGAVLVNGPASRGGQLRRGAAIARGRWLLVLHADSVPEPGWAEAVAAHLKSESGPAYFRLAFRATGFMPGWVAGWANLRSRLFWLPYGDQGLLISRSDYDRSGGYPDQLLMEDVALVRAIGRPMSALPARVFTSAERYRQAGWLRRGTRNIWTLLRYLLGADPAVLAAAYQR